MPLLMIIVLATFVLACCAIDVRTRRIPNVISGTAIAAGVLLNSVYHGGGGLVSSLSGAAVMTGLLLAPFALGGLGGGDVKMMSAVGAFLGPRLAMSSLIIGIIIGGIVMAAHLARLGRLGEKITALARMLHLAVLVRSLAPLRMAADDAAAVSLPYSIPLGLGTAAVVIAAAFGNSTSF